MEYKVEKKPAMTLTGFKRRFSGSPAERSDQECDFYLSTRTNQYLLKGLARDADTIYNVMTNFDDEGYDFYIAARLNKAKTISSGRMPGAMRPSPSRSSSISSARPSAANTPPWSLRSCAAGW